MGSLGLFTPLGRSVEFPGRLRRSLLWRRRGGLDLLGFHFLEFFVVPRRHIAFLLGTIDFLLICGKDFLLEFLPALGIDGMGYVGVEFCTALVVSCGAVAFESAAAFVAVIGAQMVLATALGAFFRQFSAGHRHKRPRRSFDNLEVPDHKIVADGNTAKSLQLLRLIIH
jgi:hypothetical protein